MCNMPASIMIVEDEKIVARDLKSTLESLGYQVPAIVDSGELAIQQAMELRPDLILMDICLQGRIDGIKAAEIIVENLDIPIVYLTAHSDDASLARAIITRPLGYLIKPFEERELRAAIEVALCQHELGHHLKENVQWFSTVVNSIGEGVMATDAKGCITLLNPVAEVITGWSFQDCVGKPATEVFKIIHETTRQVVPDPIQHALEQGKVMMLPPSTLLIRKDGTEIPIEDSVSPITLQQEKTLIRDGQQHQDNIAGTVVIFRDVTQQRSTAKKLHRHAFYDDLTNLPNRVWFRERLTDAIERLKRKPNYCFAVLLLDLDRFKSVNDSLGHLGGDHLLYAVADRLIGASRVLDTVARMGGDEFAILLEGLKSEQEAINITHRILQKFTLPFRIEGQEIFTNASIGLVLSSVGYEQVDELLRDADIAMYRAKAKGKGCYQLFDVQLRNEMVASSNLEHELRRAIERNQLQVYYQPIVSLATQRTVGFEALVRWKHPKQGLLTAGEFMPIAEEVGLSVPIDWWMLRNASQQMKQWQQLFPKLSQLYISLNLSAKQAMQSNLVDRVVGILSQQALPAACLMLEITETTLIEKPELAAKTLKALREAGIGLSLDDFGTGYSSLSYLQRFPVQTLKIDRSFVGKIDSDSDSLEIVRTIVLLGKSLGLSVVAEGIENKAQLELLREMQCDYGQGYYFAKPLPGTEITNRLRIESRL
jgi:diguanylate cyclase (GGDEF)-like protein/PAS domain S-box-containing protein